MRSVPCAPVGRALHPLTMSPLHGICVLLLLIHAAYCRIPVCQLHWELQQAEQECHTLLKNQPLYTSGCQGMWDSISCWTGAAIGEVRNQSCPSTLKHLFRIDGNINRNCTEEGWTVVYPSYAATCWPDDSNDPYKLVFYRVVKILYTLGHSLSLITLLTSASILCLFRRLRCTRNYIHLNLFVSYILRAVAVLTKDAILFSHSEHADCSIQPSLVGCKISLVFFNYFIMANFFWLLAEGLYLHTLLRVIHGYANHLPVYMLIGWGIPSVFMLVWIICRIQLENTWCWEWNENAIPKRVINWPIMASVIINFILFISIIRILIQKLRCTNVGGNDQCQYRRLAKSTLLLIPLFGVNYMVFVYLVETADKSLEHLKIMFDLCLGSFQGLVVAVLYCFLNSEVQGELRRTWRSLCLKRCVGRDCRTHTMSVSRNGAESSAHHHHNHPRSSRTQSILQTETSVL